MAHRGGTPPARTPTTGVQSPHSEFPPKGTLPRLLPAYGTTRCQFSRHRIWRKRFEEYSVNDILIRFNAIDSQTFELNMKQWILLPLWARVCVYIYICIHTHNCTHRHTYTEQSRNISFWIQSKMILFHSSGGHIPETIQWDKIRGIHVYALEIIFRVNDLSHLCVY